MGKHGITKAACTVKMKPDRADWAIQRIVQHLIDIEEGRAPRGDARPDPQSSKCPKALRKRVMAAFSACEYCGHPTDWLSVDRIVPRSRGGRYVAGNVTAACLRCNTHKRDTDFMGPVRSLAMMEADHD